ncbi:PREDICTED: uncharacterized protein LOC109184084 [Ipomoea nil]|uniref:uncharacterized protein LOC109184084 n=1 Tax=Ipomoea nil TaxID=35883 RepID=UPI000901FC19|nr:PREDICTED: uncharacterized protein LOC109184084 [Ipomoea nil]
MAQGFNEEEAPRAPRAKIALGKKKTTTGSSKEQQIPVARPLGATTTVTTAEGYVVESSDVLISRVAARKGKEEAAEKEAEDGGALKRRRKQGSPSPPVGAIAGDASILTRIGNLGPVKEDMTKLTPTQVAEKIGYDLVDISRAAQVLQCQALLANEADTLKKVVDRRLGEITDLQAELKKAKEGRELAEKAAREAKGAQELAEKAAKEALGEAAKLKSRLGNLGELTRFLCRDEASAREFFRELRKDKVGEAMIWTFGRWAFKSGQRRMRAKTQSIMEEVLDGEDLQLVLTTFPDEVADPGPPPFGPEEDVAEPSSASEK